MEENKDDNIELMEKQLKEIVKKIERIEERFVLDEIERELYQKSIKKYKTEKQEIEGQMQKMDFKVSNLSEYLDQSIMLASKLPEIWASGHYEAKQNLQYLVFPEGIYYNKQNDKCRTERVNSVFALMASISSNSIQKRSGLKSKNSVKSALVAGTGLEPATFGL